MLENNMQSNLEIKMADQNTCYAATQLKKKWSNKTGGDLKRLSDTLLIFLLSSDRKVKP